MDYGPVVKAILFALFGGLTAAVTVVTGPTYDNLFVPEMDPSAAYASWQGPNVFAAASTFSNALLVGLVDPLAVLVIVAVGLLYLLRSAHPTPRLQGLAGKLVLGILVANLVLPITSGIWQLASGVYPAFYDYGGGAWRTFDAIVGPGAVNLSWDNGVLAFVVSWTLFAMVLLLAFLLAFRAAIVAVLLVLLPPLTLLWPLPGLGSVVRKVWVLFLEMTFLPCFVVVPLILAVGSSSVLLTMGLFSVALAMPQILSVSGASLSHAGFPNASFVVGGNFLRNSEATQNFGSGLLRGGGMAFARGWRGSLPSGPTPGSGGGGSSGASGGVGHGGRKGALAPRAEASSFSVPIGGVAGLAAWGLSEGLGKLAQAFGRRAASRLTTASSGGNPGGLSREPTSQAPSPVPREKRVPGEPPGGRTSASEAGRSTSASLGEGAAAVRYLTWGSGSAVGGKPSLLAPSAPPPPPPAPPAPRPLRLAFTALGGLPSLHDREEATDG